MQCNHFNIGSLMETGIRLIGNGQAPVQKYWKDLLKYIQQDKIQPLHMVTHRFKLEDMETVYDLFNKRDPGMQKVFVQTKFSAPPAPGAPKLTELWASLCWIKVLIDKFGSGVSCGFHIFFIINWALKNCEISIEIGKCRYFLKCSPGIEERATYLRYSVYLKTKARARNPREACSQYWVFHQIFLIVYVLSREAQNKITLSILCLMQANAPDARTFFFGLIAQAFVCMRARAPVSTSTYHLHISAQRPNTLLSLFWSFVFTELVRQGRLQGWLSLLICLFWPGLPICDRPATLGIKRK